MSLTNIVWSQWKLKHVAGKKGPSFVGLLPALSPVAALAADPAYYVWDGQNLTPANTDPSEAQADTWAVWLYKKNKSQTENFHWGTSEGKSASAVMDNLKKDQAFEKKYERWCDCDWGHRHVL